MSSAPQVQVDQLPLKKALTALDKAQHGVPVPFLNRDRLEVFRDPQMNSWTNDEVCSLMTDVYFQLPILCPDLESTLERFYSCHLPYTTLVPMGRGTGEQGLLCPPNLPLFERLSQGQVFDVLLPDPRDTSRLISRRELCNLFKYSGAQLEQNVPFPQSLDGTVQYASPFRNLDFWSQALEELDMIFPPLSAEDWDALDRGTLVRQIGPHEIVFLCNEEGSQSFNSQSQSMESEGSMGGSGSLQSFEVE